MKIIRFFSLFLLLLFGSQPVALSQDTDTGNEIARLIREGNSRDLARHFNQTIQITLPGDEGRFSRTQAELIVRDFFVKYPPTSFIINHKGASADGSHYFIGVYNSSRKLFRSYYLLKKVEEKDLIHQLRFEEDD